MPDISKNMFLTSFFVTKPRTIVESDFIEFDILRGDEDIAPVLTDISTGANISAADVFTNKRIKPPAFREAEPFNVYDLLMRQAGSTEYDQPGADKMAVLMGKVNTAWRRLTDRIKRTIELQAAQILQTGPSRCTTPPG
jgi:hypothetical protein